MPPQGGTLRFRVLAEVADYGLTFRLCQWWKSFFADQTVHFGQDFLPFRYRPEPRIRHPMTSYIGHAVAASTTLRVHPSIWSVEIWDSA